MLMCVPVVCYAALPFFRAAIRDLKTRHLTMDVPVSIAILLAFLASSYITIFTEPSVESDVYFDSVSMFTFFLLVGRFLEMLALDYGQPCEQGLRLNHRLTHSDMASALGTTRVTVTRVLGTLRDEGWLLMDPQRRFIVSHLPRP